MKSLVVFFVLLVVACVVFLATQKNRMRYGEILPASEMKEKYGLTAENRPAITIDPWEVPENLRDLIPMAEFWGVGDDIIRDDIEEKASDEQKQEFRTKLAGRAQDVNAWLNSLGDGEMSDEAGHFMYMLEAFDEMGLWLDQ
jgi:hypothetical protein